MCIYAYVHGLNVMYYLLFNFLHAILLTPYLLCPRALGGHTVQAAGDKALGKYKDQRGSQAGERRGH